MGGSGRKLQQNGEKCTNRSFIHFFHLRNNIRVIKSRRMRWAEHVTPTGDTINVCRVWMKKPETNSYLEYLSSSGSKILKWILK